MKVKSFLFKTSVLFWKLLPLKKTLAQVIKKSDFLVEKLYKDLRFKGIMNVELDNEKFKLYNPGYTTIENEIFWKGLNSWEKTSVAIWQEIAKQSETILDIGANTGLFTFIAASANKSSEIFCFEPVKRTCELLKINLELNKSNNIHFYQKAVSNSTGSSIFYDVTTQSQYSSSLNKEMLEGISDIIEYEVDVIALDNLAELKNKKIDLIKLDVEMHEPEAIEGMQNLIKTNNPLILIEILNSDIGLRIEKLVENYNYEYFVIHENKGIQKTKSLGNGLDQNFMLKPLEKYDEIISKYLL